MENYTVHEEIGKGSFGSVFRATRKKDRKLVAIKKLFQKYDDWNAARSMREFRAIVDLPRESKNLCQIYDIIREQDGTLYFAMELMPSGSLKDYIESFWPSSQPSGDGSCNIATRQIIDPSSIQSIVRQVLQGLEHIHSKGYMHRDLKPENILMNGKVCKVTDFSLARTMAPSPTPRSDQHQEQRQPQHAFCSQKVASRTIHNVPPTKMTSYVSTRWYRAPEIILCAPQYSCAVDIFALGCVMAELYRLVALLPGSGEIPQLVMICELWGGPLHWLRHWPEGKRLVEKLGLEVVMENDDKQSKNEILLVGLDPSESICRSKLRAEVPSACERALTLMENCLQMNPDFRPTASEALQHDFFKPLLQKDPSCQISSITPSPVASDIRTNANSWNKCDASFLNGSPRTSTSGFKNDVHYSSCCEKKIPPNESAAVVVSKERKIDQVVSSAIQSSDHGPVLGFLSPYNKGNTSLNSIGLDKASLMGSFDSKKRPWLESITNSHRKKRGNCYKPSRAFIAERKF